MIQSNKVSRLQLKENVFSPVQNVDIINPTNDILTVNQEGNTLIWYDACLSLTNQDISKTKQVLRSVNDYVLLFDDEEKCIHYIESIDTDNIFIVISGRSSTILLPKMHHIKQVKAVCIFCTNREVYKSLSNDFGKVIGICIEQEELVTCLKKSIYSFHQQISLISLMKNNLIQGSHLNAMDAYNFKKQQLMKDIILRMPRTQQSKQKLIDYCRNYYQGNKKLSDEIDEFDEHYDSPCQAITLYTRNSLWYRMINHAFRIQDFELLEQFQFFITDLSQSLNYNFEQLKTSLTLCEQQNLTLYRAHQFSKEEYSRFPSCGFVTFNSYLSTSSDVEIAKIFGCSDDKEILSDTDLVPVLFLIELDLTSLNNNTVVLASIAGNSNFEEEREYLFDFGATFEIISIHNHIIKLIASDKPHYVSCAKLHDAYLHKFASQDIIRSIGDDSSMDNFASSLLQIDQSLNKLDAFEEYILKISFQDENYQAASKYCIDGHILPRIDPNSLYAVACRRINPNNPYPDEYTDAYNQAIRYFQAFSEYASDELIEWSLRALGYAHYKIDKYLEAEKYFIKALQMNNDSLNVITCCYYLGCIYGELSNYTKSMDFFKKILQMKDRIDPCFIAAAYFQMAMYQNKSEEMEYSSQQILKKEYLLLALDIYERKNEELFILKCRSELLKLEDWPSTDNCVNILDRYYKYCQVQQIDLESIIEVYESIGYSYFKDFEYDQALKCYMKTVLYFPNKIRYHRIIADIYIKKKDSKSAIEHLNKMLKLTKDSKIIVDCHLLMGLEYFKQNNFPMALQCLTQGVQVCNDSDRDTQFNEYTFGFELERKSQIETCRSMINANGSKLQTLYFCTEGLVFSLDFIKLFQLEILFFLESIDRIEKSDYTEQMRYIMEENGDNNNESHLEKLILKIVFVNYISMGDVHNDDALFYYAKALEIDYKRTKVKTIRDIESVCTSKINSILKSNYSSSQLINHIQELLRLNNSQNRTQEQQDRFRRNYFVKLKQNQLALLYSHIADIYSKMKMYKDAIVYYDKSIKYYETFPLLFHLEIADLYSKKGFLIHAQQVINNDNIILHNAQELFENAVAIILKQRRLVKTKFLL